MRNWQLFIACVAIWSTTWIAITFQLGDVAPEVSVAYRFLLASLILFGFCRYRGLSLRFTRREHAWFALFGIFMFGVSYVFIYHAEQHVVSGLVAVGYSASPLLGMVGMRVFFGTPMTLSVAVGSVLGIIGIVLVFLPAVGHARDNSIAGFVYTILGVLASSLGAMVAHRNQRAELPLWQSMAWGMLYGAMLSLVAALVAGEQLRLEVTNSYLLSLLYLAIFGSIIAFAGYLTLLARIGAARASYVGVMVPVLALVISAGLEGFRWYPITMMGIAISVAGNIVILRK